MPAPFGYYLNSYELLRVSISRGFAKDQVCDGQGHMFSSTSDTRTLIAGSGPKLLRSLIWAPIGRGRHNH